MALLRRLWRSLAGLAILGSLVIRTVLQRSPMPLVRWLRSQPDPGCAKHPESAAIRKRVAAHKDIRYPSAYNSNEVDVYYPKDAREKLPTILWVHGGSFVAGDKSGTADWCAVMADRGYAVVSMNYEVAPEARYPAPLRQMSEVAAYLAMLADRFPALDPERLIIGGDSAGAQIVSQFVAIQTNPELARLSGIRPTVPEGTLRAAVLYCGPYNVERLADGAGGLRGWLMRQLGWAYLGERKWSSSAIARQASTVHQVSDRFPPVFITDGNTGSFEAHGLELAEKLRSLGVAVDTLFFDAAAGAVPHEYQFQLDTPEALRCLERTLDFLEGCVGTKREAG
ncbi:alpha/beta hydrolase [Paenibacillus methanolicus]|uniref:Acetyl esterase/lipase n=1 Tax=Paenibacillus methanolicus TaxID=582686 RepID=A0A5S5C7K6_9BACL|nr:alpha/beta hydrolase [Paenibacillus methanolicus]TYP74588.1 acetyl esterase/lipase [Paenibacillus methanolicus]